MVILGNVPQLGAGGTTGRQFVGVEDAHDALVTPKSWDLVTAVVLLALVLVLLAPFGSMTAGSVSATVAVVEKSWNDVPVHVTVQLVV